MPESRMPSPHSADMKTEGRWTQEEQDLFLQAFAVFGRDWKKISKVVKTRNNVQCRTHAQHLERKNALGGDPRIASRPSPVKISKPKTSSPQLDAKCALPLPPPSLPPPLAVSSHQVLESFRHQLAMQRYALQQQHPLFAPQQQQLYPPYSM